MNKEPLNCDKRIHNHSIGYINDKRYEKNNNSTLIANTLSEASKEIKDYVMENKEQSIPALSITQSKIV